MRAFIQHTLVVLVALLIAMYVSEGALGTILVRSLVSNYLPPYAVQHDKRAEYNPEYRYNGLGLRGDDFDPNKTYDITLLGDSFLFGQGVDLPLTIYGLLRQSGKEVFNAAEIATNPLQYLHHLSILRSLGLKTKQLTIGFYTGNDFVDYGNSESALARPYDVRSITYDLSSFLLLERSRYMVGVVCQKLWSCSEPSVRPFTSRKKFRDDWLAWMMQTDDEAVLAKIRNQTYQPIGSETAFLQQATITPRTIGFAVQVLNRIATTLGDDTQVTLLLIPTLHAIRGELGAGYAQALATFVAGLSPKIRVLDLHGKLTSDMYYAGDLHWNAAANRFVATQLLWPNPVLAP